MTGSWRFQHPLTFAFCEKMKTISAILISLALLAAPGCVSTSTKDAADLPDPDAMIDVYFDGQLWGSLGIFDGLETKREFDDFIMVLGKPTGLGVEIVARDFRITEASASGNLEIEKRWIDPELQDPDREYPQFPVFSIRRMTSNRILLNFDSPYTADGWHLVLRRKEDTEQNAALNCERLAPLL